ncbi:MAG: hypothetical protein AB7Q17_06305 [Phycisphaerae bacterium]
MDECARQRQFEDHFLGQLRQRALALLRRGIPADAVVFDSLPDGVDTVRATLARLQVYDRQWLDRLPGTRTLEARFQRNLLGGLLRRGVGRLRAQVLAATDALVRGEPVGPVGREEVLDALARYDLLPRDRRPTAVVLASPTGFSDAARALVGGRDGPSLILMGGRADGGWTLDLPDSLRKSAWAKLFDFESGDEQLRRLMYHLEQSAVELDAAGVPLTTLAEKLGLAREQTAALVHRACRATPRLMTTVHNGVTHVCRAPLVEEGRPMSVWTRIRRLLRLKPTPAELIRGMTLQRVRLEQQRQEVDQKVELLAREESSALERARNATNDAERAQVVATLKRVRGALSEQRAMAQAYSNKIDILGTQIHNLSIRAVGDRTGLPTREQIAQQAAEAEAVTSELATDADFARGVRATAASPLSSAEDDALWAEVRALGETAEPASKRPSAAPAPAASAPDSASRAATSASRAPAAPTSAASPTEKSKARPEAG